MSFKKLFAIIATLVMTAVLSFGQGQQFNPPSSDNTNGAPTNQDGRYHQVSKSYDYNYTMDRSYPGDLKWCIGTADDFAWNYDTQTGKAKWECLKGVRIERNTKTGLPVMKEGCRNPLNGGVRIKNCIRTIYEGKECYYPIDVETHTDSYYLMQVPVPAVQKQYDTFILMAPQQNAGTTLGAPTVNMPTYGGVFFQGGGGTKVESNNFNYAQGDAAAAAAAAASTSSTSATPTSATGTSGGSSGATSAGGGPSHSGTQPHTNVMPRFSPVRVVRRH